MAKLSTRYLGLDLRSPIIVSSGPLTQDLESLKKAEAAGAGAVVLKSIFEEQIEGEVSKHLSDNSEYLDHSSAEGFFQASYANYYIDRYIKLLVDAKKALSIPVIASINCNRMDNWIEYAERFQTCGADAIELNYYPIASEASVTGAEVDKRLMEFAKTARKKISIPLSLKIGRNYSSLANAIKGLDAAGIDGVVLFNRFFRPDIDIRNLKMVSMKALSSADEYADSLRWTALMSAEVGMDIAANTGVHSGETAIKMLLAGAKAVEVCSVLMEKGVEEIGRMNDVISSWMDEKGYKDIPSFQGLLAQERSAEGYKWERTQFLKTI